MHIQGQSKMYKSRNKNCRSSRVFYVLLSSSQAYGAYHVAHDGENICDDNIRADVEKCEYIHGINCTKIQVTISHHLLSRLAKSHMEVTKM